MTVEVAIALQHTTAPDAYQFPFPDPAATLPQMIRTLSAALCLVCVTTPLAAQPTQPVDAPLTFPLTEVLALADNAHLDRTGFRRALEAVLPILTTDDHPLTSPPLDPFLWALTGSFGTEGAEPRPGAIFGCARYGLGTRDVFAQHGLASSLTFALMRHARPQYDDAQAWPDGAVARLYCSFVWDDRRVVAILDEADTQAGLASLFDVLTSLPQTAGTFAIYGEEGFRIDATSAPADSVIHVDSARMTLTLGHQALSFRAFLMGGGV